MPSFIGIDLAWRGDKNHTGVRLLEGDRSGLEVKEFSTGVKSLNDILTLVERLSSTDTIVAIDAPLVIRNPIGQRPCETEISRRFSNAHAGAHTSNLRLYPQASSVQLAGDFERIGFSHCPSPHSPGLPGRWFFEVYPHPAHVVMFGRDRVIKYKKGRVATRRIGLTEFRENIGGHFSRGDPPLLRNDLLQRSLSMPLEGLRGQSLKYYEDVLDSLFCAYLAAYFWAWSYDRNEMIGDLASGYIINPKPMTSRSAK